MMKEMNARVDIGFTLSYDNYIKFLNLLNKNKLKNKNKLFKLMGTKIEYEDLSIYISPYPS